MEVRMQTVASNPAQTMRLSRPRTTQEQRTRTMEIDRLRGRILTRQAFRDACQRESVEWLKHEAAIADYERQIAKLEGAKDA